MTFYVSNSIFNKTTYDGKNEINIFYTLLNKKDLRKIKNYSVLIKIIDKTGTVILCSGHTVAY